MRAVLLLLVAAAVVTASTHKIVECANGGFCDEGKTCCADSHTCCPSTHPVCAGEGRCASADGRVVVNSTLSKGVTGGSCDKLKCALAIAECAAECWCDYPSCECCADCAVCLG